MRETKTSMPGSDCPTLMHYLARVLMRSDPNILRFIEDMPSLEAAGRGMQLSLTIQIFSP